MRLHPSLADFSPAMVAATQAALDAGIFSQDEFARWVLERMGGINCPPTLLQDITLPIDGTSETQQANQRTLHALYAAIGQAPRGTYAILRSHHLADRYHTFRALVSDGSGDPAPGGVHDLYDGLPDSGIGDTVVRRMLRYEIYLCRRAAEAERARTPNRHAIERYHLCAGYTHRGRFQLSGLTYSTTTITQVDPNAGMLTLRLIRRGSPRRYQATIEATTFLRAAGLPPGGPSPSPS